jgi:hypothetical protein
LALAFGDYVSWMLSQHQDFGGKSPLEMLEAGEFDKVL